VEEGKESILFGSVLVRHAGKKGRTTTLRRTKREGSKSSHYKEGGLISSCLKGSEISGELCKRRRRKKRASTAGCKTSSAEARKRNERFIY